MQKGSDFKVISITWASLKAFYTYATFFPIVIIFMYAFIFYLNKTIFTRNVSAYDYNKST